jgi:hypothetical protein
MSLLPCALARDRKGPSLSPGPLSTQVATPLGSTPLPRALPVVLGRGLGPLAPAAVPPFPVCWCEPLEELRPVPRPWLPVPPIGLTSLPVAAPLTWLPCSLQATGTGDPSDASELWLALAPLHIGNSVSADLHGGSSRPAGPTVAAGRIC